jgi:AraC-like DNA-binding protein
MQGIVPWNFCATQRSTTVVAADGCRDVLLLQSPDRPPRIILTDLDAGPRKVAIERGVRYTGFRLQPGLDIESDSLQAVTPETLSKSVDSLLRHDADILRAVERLGAGDSLRRSAAELGVSPRSLQRRFRARDLPPPDFWRLLGRARAAAQALARDWPLAWIAADSGYSDQAHMTREFVRWFGMAPCRLRQAPELLRTILQPGLGNWTGEHSSIKNPSGSAT